MLRKILIVSLFIFATLGFSASDYDKDITVLNQSRNDKVVAVFKEMMRAYEEEDLSGFFSYVSEDRFIQDYMTFYDAIDKDMRVYDILNVDTWVDKITEDGIKRYLYVTWEKRYQSTSSDKELFKRGYSRFLFDEVNGKYKLIGLAGNNFWGGSLAEWREEVPEIPGQILQESNGGTKESADDGYGDATGGLPDLTISENCTNGYTFVINNIGTADTTSGSIQYALESEGGSSGIATYNSDIPAGGSSSPIDCGVLLGYGGSIVVDPDNLIEELDESNNIANISTPY